MNECPSNLYESRQKLHCIYVRNLAHILGCDVSLLFKQLSRLAGLDMQDEGR